MKEAIGTTMVFNLVIIFVTVFIALYVGSISYTKGFKVRNRIIQIIEKNDGLNDKARKEIYADLQKVGYNISSSAINKNSKCKKDLTIDSVEDKYGILDEKYNFCTYEYNTDRGPYYGVRVFIHVDIPLIGDLIEIPLYGETRVLYMKDRVEN